MKLYIHSFKLVSITILLYYNYSYFTYLFSRTITVDKKSAITDKKSQFEPENISELERPPLPGNYFFLLLI